MIKRRKKITTLDIAREAGVSRATVSRVFANPELVREQTREKVLRVAQQHKYFPNSIASALKSDKARQAVTIVIPNIDEGFQAELVKGCMSELRDHGYNLMIIDNSDNSMRTSEYLDSLKRQISAGVIFCYENDETAIETLSRSTPVISFEYRSQSQSIDSLCLDLDASFRISLDYLIHSRGHSRIGVLTGRRGDEYAEKFVRKYREHMGYYGIDVPEEYVFGCGWSLRHGAAVVQELIKLPVPPTALVVVSAELAKSAIVCCEEQGIRVGRDISILTVDATSSNRFFIPQITCLEYSVTEVGRKLAQMMLRKLDDSTDQKQEFYVSPSGIREGGSVGHGG